MTVNRRGNSRPARTDALGEGTLGGEETRGVAWRLNPLPVSRSLTWRWRRMLRPVGTKPMVPWCSVWKTLVRRCSVARPCIGHDHAWHVGHTRESLTEDLLCGPHVPSAWHHEIEDGSVAIHGAPESVTLALDHQKHFIHMPRVAGPGTAATEVMSRRLPECAPPCANRLIAHAYATFKESRVDIAVAHADSNVPPDGVTTDLHRNARVLIRLRGGW